MFYYSVQLALNSADSLRANTFASGRNANVAVSEKSAPVIYCNPEEDLCHRHVDEGLPSVEANEFCECMHAAIQVCDENSDPIRCACVCACGPCGQAA